jgi:DNA-binding response OmpR family regulator
MKVTPAQVQAKTHACDILVVDADGKSADVIRKAAPDSAAIRSASGSEEALLELRRKPADIVLVNVQIQDNAGAGLLETIRKTYPNVLTIAMSRSHTADACVSAIRAGAGDVLFSPLKLEETRTVIASSIQKSTAHHKQMARHARLRTVCRRLNKARHEISAQVDLLCNDLVRAYQDLASQLNQTQAMGDFAASIEKPSTLEDLMRATLEWILKKLGPINAAVMLPNSENEFSLGAYLNLDTPAADPFIAAIGSTIAPQAASGGLLAIENDREISDLFGPPGDPLHGRNWMAHSCNFRTECLGVLLLFRTQGTPFDPVTGAMLQAIAPILGEQIGKLMQRNHPQPADGGEGEAEANEIPKPNPFHKNRCKDFHDDEPPTK